MPQPNRLDRVNALMRRVIGEACFTVLGTEGLDLSAITVTRVATATNLRDATVYVSIFGHESERGRYLHALAAHHRDFQAVINREMKLKYTPVLHFRADESVEKGDHVLDILLRMEQEDSAAGERQD